MELGPQSVQQRSNAKKQDEPRPLDARLALEHDRCRHGQRDNPERTTIKLARALWIVPLAMATAIVFKSKARIQWPWFILFFCIAALLNTLQPRFHAIFGALNHMGKLGLTVTLFLIGAGLNRETLRKVGIRPLLQGLTLWGIVGVGTLAVILFNWIRV